jgi:hypothetical protein
MKIESYPSDSDFEEFIEEYVKLNDTQKFLKKQKNFVVATHKTSIVADISRRIFFGMDDTEQLKKIAEKPSSKKSTGFEVKSGTEVNELISELNEMKRSGDPINEDKDMKVKNVQESEDEIEVDIEYTKKNKGAIGLMNEEDKETQIKAEINEEDEVSKITQEYGKNDEFQAGRDFIESINEDEDIEVNEERVSIEELPLEDRLSLFRELLDYDYDEWRLDDVESVSVKKGEDVEELDDEELRGITKASLSGSDLMSNPTVQSFESEDFYFKEAKLAYHSVDEAKLIVVEIAFKGKPKESFDVAIKKEFETTDDGRDSISLEPRERSKIRDTFRDAVIEKYSEVKEGNLDENNEGNETEDAEIEDEEQTEEEETETNPSTGQQKLF